MTVWIQNPFDNLPSEGYRKQRYWLMAEAFVRAGHEVVYWTSDFSHARKKCRGLEGLECLGGLEGLEGLGGLDVQLIATRPYPKNVCLKRIASHRDYAREWLRVIRDLPNFPNLPNLPKLIISSCPTLSAAEAAIELGRKLGAKVVVDVQDAWPETFERLAPRGLRWLAKMLLAPMRRQAQRIYREADLVTGVCDRYRELTERPDYYRAYLGIEGRGTGDGDRRNERWTAGVNRKIRLVYSGNLGKSYDLGTIVKTVEANGDFELDVAGFGDFACACPRVRFHGMLSAQDLQALFAQCDIGVVPMANESWVGVPNKFFDYSAAGLAIVSSLGGESARLLRRHGCGVAYRHGDAASLAAAVRQVMTFERGASRKMCAAEFDARTIYDAYVERVTALVQNS